MTPQFSRYDKRGSQIGCYDRLVVNDTGVNLCKNCHMQRSCSVFRNKYFAKSTTMKEAA